MKYFHKIWWMIWGCIKLKQTVNLQDVIKTDDENCKSKRG